MKRSLTGAILALSLLVGGVGVGGPAVAGPSSPATPPATAAHKAHEGVRAPKGMPSRPGSSAKRSDGKASPQLSDGTVSPQLSDGTMSTQAFVPCSSACFFYGTGMQSHNAADGVSVNTTVQKPLLVAGDYHTLFEVATVDTAANNTIEFGWNVDVAVNGDSDPHLFTFIWDGGVDQCYNGCPAGTGAQYLDAVGCSPWCAGDNLAAYIGTAHTFEIRHYSTGTAGWWMSVDGVFRGVWPDTEFTTVSTTSNFTQVFGEVALANTPSETDMGSGVLSTSTNGALVQNYTLINSTSTPSLVANGNQMQPDRWNWTSLSATSFRYGGPGGHENLPTVSPTCSGVGISPTWGGYGSFCPYSNTSGGVPVTPIHVLDKDGTVTRNICFPNYGTADGITTTPVRVFENTTYVKWAWFRDPSCAGAHIDIDYDKTVLPVGWIALTHASLMRWSTPNSH